MNIYELEKMATPGPWRNSDIGIVSDAQELFEGAGPLVVVRTIGHCQGDNPDADMCLVSHCRNNYVKAVTLLSKLVVIESIIRGGSGDLSGNADFKAQIQEARDALAELEEVK